MFKSILPLAAAFVLLTATNEVAKADPVGGTQIASYVVKGNTNDVYNVKLRGGEQTRIRISGDGDTCLELRVYDENGNLVASDTQGFGDDRGVLITPKWTGMFTVKIRNLGSVGNKYVIKMD